MASTKVQTQLKDKLKEVFGYNQFRGNQEVIIQHILDRKNTFVIMPTGAGKSLCYQLPALMQEGTAIVISPLIALMKNQVDQLQALGVDASFLNSTLSKSESNRVKKETLEGKTKLLYVAPESLTKEDNIELLRKSNISFIAIDEAHCISEWGHDFRPEYRRIKQIIEAIGDLPIIALTATATPKVRADIQKNLKMEDANIFLSSFHRDNLFYEILPKTEPKVQLIRFIRNHQNKSGIIYCLSRKKVEEVAEFLRINGVNALPYHAGMDSAQRMGNQDAFLNEDCDVIVATIAFGMGIDKPDVRFVIHYDAPKSLEGYYQETGRAGRDGLESFCMMLFSESDIAKLEKFHKDKSVTERENVHILLQEMSYYAHSSVCRTRQLLHYFGEDVEHNCNHCDNCKTKHASFNAKDQILLALKTVEETESRFGIEHICNVLTGTKSDYVESYNHTEISTFGKGSEFDNQHWESIIRQSMINSFLSKDVENVTLIKVTEKGKKYQKEPYNLDYTQDYQWPSELEALNEEAVVKNAFDKELFDILKAKRKKVANQKGIPPYAIFQEPSLEEMATSYPTTQEELMQINGVGAGKAKKFGKPFIDIIADYVEKNEITTAKDVVVKSTVNKSKSKISIILQIDRKQDIEDIAESLKISFDDVLDEIENICDSGTKLNLDYYIETIMDEERMDEIYDYFMQAESDDLNLAYDELDEEIGEDEIRLIRIKFLSEVAN
ncbi:DNA helicase RecQ [Flammeovirga kamogawensis]|uniref:DNA helicase RecQ n=1 Tax=Flammeovirga kamogawensis TaxID=373891 RepID=A0ABX8GTH5_9BACT|nr:DNA helicase RecQ [Flammeovirga kamogawensis]MBB6462441.1 ATP-dependent DNA helicase RecQ [Flammeovirga kamogawensis]QWG06821.1 DNA helicase RecQ [Flammeovirga kamogawensis]TRX68644.1 DNA helicase RecQ [Flammeovirga kamogawensis]